MTFAEYNTDDNYDNKNGFESSLEELVKLGKSEGMTKDAIRSSLSPKWQKSSKLNKFDEYYGEETKPTEEKVTEKVIETSTPKKNETTSKISDKDENFIEQTSSIADTSEDKENERQRELETQRWNSTMDRMKKTGEAFRNIDDHMVEQLPTFMFKRYQNGEFGDPKGSDAKLRLAHFMINGLGTALSNMSHVIRKDGVQEQSDAEKYQQTNLEEGLRNRWNKYKADTQAAIDLAVKEGADEQELQSSVAKISSTNRLNTAFNMMNENQKVYTLRVLSKIGNEIGNMNNKDFVNTLIGFATSGDNLSWQEAAELLIARFGKDALGAIKQANEDGATEGAKETTAGFGVGGIGGNLKGYKTIDGKTVDFDFTMNEDAKNEMRSMMDDLSNRYYNGEIDAETFKKYYTPLYEESKKHMKTGSLSPDQLIKANNTKHLNELDSDFENLNKKAKSGEISPSRYEEEFNKLKESATKWGASEKELKSIDKGKVSSEKILKAANKKK